MGGFYPARRAGSDKFVHCGARSPIDQLRSPWTQLLPLRTKEVAIWPILPQGDTGIKERTEAKATGFRGRPFTALQPAQCQTARTSTLHSPLQPREKTDGERLCRHYCSVQSHGKPSDTSETPWQFPDVAQRGPFCQELQGDLSAKGKCPLRARRRKH